MSNIVPEHILHCSFCGTSQNDVRTLIAGPGTYICENCVDTCLEVFAEKGLLEQLPQLRKIGVVRPRDELNIEKLGLKPRFTKLSFELKSSTCIYLCPFSEPFNTIYLDHIKPAVESVKHSVFRVDEIFGTGPIIDDIWDGIASSEVVLADVTGRNPNVMYEIGMAHTIGKPVIIITQQIADIPFDLRHQRCIVYEYTPRGCKDLELKVSGTLTFLKS